MLGPTPEARPLEMDITTPDGCTRFVLPPTFDRPKRLLHGTVAPCSDDSAAAAFVGRRRF